MATDYDVAVVGGGPAGCSTGAFTARYGLDTVVFDRGNSSLRQCAYLENYLGFPAGIDVNTFYGLIHDHAESAGCSILPELVESVEPASEGFVLETSEGRSVTAGRVVAAARYDAEFLRGLDDDEAMFTVHSHGEEEHEHFDRDYANDDGTTPIEGVYVAAPAGDAEAQAIISAGRGARVARTVIADVRRERGYPDEMANQWDWIRREATLEDEWSGREPWREWFDERMPDDHDLSEERLAELRERDVDRRLDAYVSTDEIDRRTEQGHANLLEHVDDDAILKAAREIEAERPPAGED